MHRTVLTLALAFGLVLAVTVAPASVAAQSADDDLLDDVLGNSTSDQALALGEGFIAGLWGALDRQQTALLRAVGLGPEYPAAEQEAADVQQFFNQHSAAFVAYANNRTTAGDARDVINFTYVIEGEEYTHVLVAQHSNGTWDSAEIVNSTSRTVDESCRLEGYAAANASEELERAYEQFVTTGETPSAAYIGRLTGQYRPHVECSFIMGA